MKLPAFDYACPTTLTEAVALLGAHVDAKAIAGGQSLVPMLAFRVASPSMLVDLRKLPGLDQIKIDRTFVGDILVDPISGAVAQAIISFGKAMGLQVIAEGVETEEQRAFLARLGCHSFQGYLFSHPLPLGEFNGV